MRSLAIQKHTLYILFWIRQEKAWVHKLTESRQKEIVQNWITKEEEHITHKGMSSTMLTLYYKFPLLACSDLIPWNNPGVQLNTRKLTKNVHLS